MADVGAYRIPRASAMCENLKLRPLDLYAVELSEALGLILSKGLDYAIELFRRGEIKRDDLAIILSIMTAKNTLELNRQFEEFRKEFSEFRKEFDGFRKEFGEFRKEFDERLDVISN
jgi:hypothetical protein